MLVNHVVHRLHPVLLDEMVEALRFAGSVYGIAEAGGFPILVFAKDPRTYYKDAATRKPQQYPRRLATGRTKTASRILTKYLQDKQPREQQEQRQQLQDYKGIAANNNNIQNNDSSCKITKELLQTTITARTTTAVATKIQTTVSRQNNESSSNKICKHNNGNDLPLQNLK